MKLYLYISLFLIVGIFSSFDKPKPAIKWYEWNEGYELAKKLDKPVYVHVFASWCPYCKQMDKETYKDAELIRMMNENFINIRFNPEENKEKYIMDKYVLNGTQLLLLIGNKKLTGYPGEIFIFPGGKGIFVQSGFQEVVEMKKIVLNVLNKKNSQDEKSVVNDSEPKKESQIKEESLIKTEPVNNINISETETHEADSSKSEVEIKEKF